MIALALALLGCGSAPSEAPAEGPITLRVFLDGAPGNGGGKLVVQAEYDPEGELVLPEPTSVQPGYDPHPLDFTPDGPPEQERIGDRSVVTQRYVFKGPRGAYEIPPLSATWRSPTADPGEVEVQSSPVFVDLGVEPPRDGELADIADPAEVRPFPWWVVGVVGGVFAAGLAIAYLPRRRRTAPAAPPVPPHLAAMRAWEKVRDDPALTIDDKAREVTRIFREYVEAVLGFEATSRTSSELLGHLGSLRHLPEGNVPRSRRILRAADRVKFAEERPADAEDAWLSELDADLRAFVDSTKPTSWAPPADRPGGSR